MKTLLEVFGIALAVMAMFIASLFGDADAQIIPSIPYTLTNGSLADATQVMGNFNTIVTDVNASAATSGANTNITSLTGLTTPLSNTYGGTVIYTGGTTGGSANAQTLTTVVPSNFALTAGNIVTGVAGATNTTSTTLNVNAQGAKQTAVQTPLGLISTPAKTFVTGQGFVGYYDGTYFEIIGGPPNSVANSQLALMSNNTFKGNISGADAVPSDLSLASTQQKINAFIKLNRQTFTVAGTSTYTPCTGIIYADMEVWGGGGAGGGAGTVANFSGGGGGGAGGYAKSRASAATIGASQTVTIGAAGAGSSNADGGTGGTSSIGTIVSATGGLGGVHATTAAPFLGGAGGAGSAGDIQKTGSPGFAGLVDTAGTASAISGMGGSSSLGGAGISVIYQGAASQIGNAAVANSGSGGSGGAQNNATSVAGGAGGTGYAVVTEYCNQ